jgi:PEP-CTERM motif
MVARLRILIAALAALGVAPTQAASFVTVPLVSDTTWEVFDPARTFLGLAQNVCLDASCPAGATSYGYALGGWTADLSSIPGANWIWAPGITGATSPAFPSEFSFSKAFSLPGTATAGTISVAVDDLAEVLVNGTPVGTTGSVTAESVARSAQSSLTTFDIASFLVAGTNVITVRAANGAFACDAGLYSCNPAGLVFGGSVQAIPEPETYAMLVAGLGLLSFMLRRPGVLARFRAHSAA